MRPFRWPLGASVAAGVAAAIALLLALAFLWLAVTLPFETEVGPTRDVVKSEALMVATAGLFGYATWGLVAGILGRRVRWIAVGSSYLLGLLAAPVAWLLVIAFYSGG